MTYEQFANAVKAAGLVPRHCNPLHWQIRGGKHVVNFYPETKRGQRFYVDRAQHGTNGDLSRALRAATGEISFPMRKIQKPKQRFDADMHSRWQQHRKDGGKLSLEQFTARAHGRERDSIRDIDKRTRRELANDIFEDLPDGAFYAASEEMFGLEAEDWIDD